MTLSTKLEGQEYEIVILNRDSKELIALLAHFYLTQGSHELKSEEGFPINLEIVEESGQVSVSISTDAIRGTIARDSRFGDPMIAGNTRKIMLSKKRGTGESAFSTQHVVALRPTTR